MLRHARAAGIAAASGALAFYVFLTADYRSSSAIHLRTDGDLRAIGRGFYPLEQDGDRTFAWTAPRAELTIPAIDRRVDWRLAADVSIWRPPDVPRPRVTVSVDGVPVLDRVFRGPFALDIAVPRRPDANHATIIIDTTPEFVPGPQDPRKLGVSLASLSIEPVKDSPRPPVRTAVAGMLAIAALGIAAGLLRLPTLWIGASMIAIAWAQAWLMTRGVAAHVTYSSQALSVAAALGAAALAAVWMAEAVRRERLNLVTLAAVALSLAACYLKLMVLMHPSMPIGDGVFHAHRLEYVMGGRLYFTSVTPDNYTFPYPVLLYVAAAPFSFLTADTLDRLTLLRFVTTVADAGAGILLYWMVVRATSDRLASFAAVVWYHAIPITPWIMTWGNLTNAFAQSLFVASLALVVGLPVQSERRWTVALLAFTTSAALLTHPSTCAILIVVLTITGALYVWRTSELRSSGQAVLVSTALAAALALGLYYAWFPSVYVSELSRAASEAGSRVSAATTPGVRLARAVDLATMYFGWAAMAASAVGAWLLSGMANARRLTLLISAWAGTCLVFLAVGILTPIDLRYHFAAFPALAIAAGLACAWAWRSGILPRVAATLVVSAGAWEGASQWMRALSPR